MTDMFMIDRLYILEVILGAVVKQRHQGVFIIDVLELPGTLLGVYYTNIKSLHKICS